MSILRDQLFVQSVAEANGLGSVQKDATRLILIEVELKLRNLIKEATKFATHFNRETLTNEDINLAA